MRQMRQYSQAEEMFLEAIRLYEEAGLQDTAEYASVLGNLSLVYQDTRQVDKAIHYLEQAVAILETLPENRLDMAVRYNNLMALYHAAGDEDQALRCANCALSAYERLPIEERIHHVAVLNSIAGFLYGAGEYERSLALYRKSSRCILEHYGENEEYGFTCQSMRWAYEKLGDYKGAADCLHKAVEVYRKVLGPNHIRTVTVEDDLARMEAAHSA